MGQVHPLPQTSGGDVAPLPDADAIVDLFDTENCELCGAPLGARSLRYHLVSPHSSDRVTVCHVCRMAALGEGYRPAG